MKKIFLSYSVTDEKLVNETYNILISSLINYKIFKFNNHQYEKSQSWAELDKNINEADIYLIFISKISMQSPSVRAELYAALHKSINSKSFTIKPIIIEDYTNWENEFKPESFPILNSIHRIEEFSQDPKNLAEHIVKNIELNQWPNYIPNIKLMGFLIPSVFIDTEGKGKRKQIFVLILKSNISLSKVEFIYRTKQNYLNDRQYASIVNGISCTFKQNVTIGSLDYNFLSLLDNSEISKNENFIYVFQEGFHFLSQSDEIIDLRLKISLNSVYPIHLIKMQEMTNEEINENLKKGKFD